MPKENKNDQQLYMIMYLIGYVFLLVLSLHAAHLMSTENVDFVNAYASSFVSFNSNPLGFLPFTFLHLQIIFYMSLAYLVCGMLIYYQVLEDSKRMKKNENGSAEWFKNMNDYNKKYTDPAGSKEKNGANNMILGQDVFLSMNTRQTLRNNNILVIGGSGTGKSRFFIKPNILEANCSYVITDPSGELSTSMGKYLEENGYKVKIFNLVDMEHSNCYNPLNYIRDDLGVLMLVNCLIKNTTPPGKGGGDPFWEKSETALLQALIFYLIKYRPKVEQNFTNVMKLLRAAEVDENNPNAKSKLDRLFDEVARNDPNSIALKQYTTFKMGAGKTLKSILISCAVRLTVFNMREIENLTGTDNIDLGTLGDEKQALFVIIPAADDTYNFLVSMMYSQLFETLYYHAENECPKGYYIMKDKTSVRFCKTEEDADKYIEEHKSEGYTKKKGDKRLASHVRFLLDEFANIGQIPEFDKKLATMRKYEISCSIVLQNLAQLKEMYDKKADGLVGNCDTIIFLGSSEPETCKYISEKLGKTTITIRTTSKSRGGKGGGNMSYNRSGRELMTPDEVSRMDNKECIIFIRGLQAFRSNKFDYTKHKMYSHTGDAKDENLYDVDTKFNNKLSVLEKSISNVSTVNQKINIQKVQRPIGEVKEGLQKENNEIKENKRVIIEEKEPKIPNINIEKNIQTVKKENSNRNTTQKSDINIEKTIIPSMQVVEKEKVEETPKSNETKIENSEETKRGTSYNRTTRKTSYTNRNQRNKSVQSRNETKKTVDKKENTNDKKEEWNF